MSATRERPLPFVARGVIPAVLLPFSDDLSIDVDSYRRHLRRVCATAGLAAITANGHSSEIASCSFAEQRLALQIAVEETAERLPVVCGVYATGSIEAARLAAMAHQHRASALLVFPPEPFISGVQQRPQMAHEHYARITAASDLPIIHFQYALGTGQGLPLEHLLELVQQFPTIVAIKDWVGDPHLHERQIRALHALPRRVSVLSTHSSWLLGSLVLGADGLLSGSGSVIADRQVELFEAVQTGDLPRAQRAWNRIFPLAEAFYRVPWADMHNRMKWALHLLGELDRPTVRPPLTALTAEERKEIAEALVRAHLTLPALAAR
jgi:4-hydroxy-tetrahydrodipicolinate synthase